jgi:hypothetical protein
MSTPKLRLFALISVLAMVGALLVVPVTAVAQGPTDDPSSAQYDPPIPDGDVAAGLGGGGTGTGTDPGTGGGGLSSNIGSLPFTGMDLIIVAGVAFILTGTGFALRRLSTPRGPHV